MHDQQYYAGSNTSMKGLHLDYSVHWIWNEYGLDHIIRIIVIPYVSRKTLNLY